MGKEISPVVPDEDAVIEKQVTVTDQRRAEGAGLWNIDVPAPTSSVLQAN